MPGERGQATSDYVAAVLVVAVATLGAGAAARSVGAGDVAGAVQRQVARALCVVGRGSCEVDRLPCVVAQRRTTDTASLTVAFLRLGHERVLLREERSDGTVAVTLVDRAKPGVVAGLGAHGRLRLQGRSLTVGGELSAAAVAVLGTGRTWILPDARAADDLLERVRSLRPSALRGHGRAGRGRHDARAELLPPADQAFSDRGLSVSAAGTLLGAQASLEAEDVFGTRTDRRSGQVTAYVRRRNALVGSVATLSRAGDRSEQYAVVLDRGGRPLDLVVLDSGTGTAPRQVGVRAPGVGTTGSARGYRAEGRLWTTETHLDLTDPDNLAAARSFLAQVRAPSPRLGDVVRVSDALRRRLDERGVVHARTLELSTSGVGMGAGVALGLEVGGEVEHAVQSARLVEAATRGPDGVWRRRDDCLTRA